MSLRNTISSKYIGLAPVFILSVAVFAGLSSHVSAQSPVSSADNFSVGCSVDSNANTVSVTLASVPVFQAIYLRSQPNQTISPTMILFQSFATGQCINLGTSTPKTSIWTQIDSSLTPKQLSAGGTFMATSQTVGSAPYESALEILLLPDASTCKPTSTCQTSYHGWQGALDPTIISGATDQIAVYVAEPIVSSRLNIVNYYDNQVFLYSKPNLVAIDNDYLSGGENVLTAVANFKNGEQFVSTKYVNMGPDYSDYYWLRSSLYRSGGRAVFILKMAGFVAVLILLLLLVRHSHNKRLYKLEHGLKGYRGHSKEENTPKDKPISG